MVERNLHSPEEAQHKLQRKQSHRDHAQPGVQRVEVRNLLLVVRIPDGHEANHYARDRAGVEEGMAQLDDQVRTAATDSVQQDGYNDKNMYETFGPAIVHGRYRQTLTESGQRDVATDHEHRVQVELQLRVVHVEALPVIVQKMVSTEAAISRIEETTTTSMYSNHAPQFQTRSSSSSYRL
uniref:Uncharacterized protein n=1 Tax=Anopheles melas TaxID=34690 RepID=A0A182TPM8_9DIPT